MRIFKNRRRPRLLNGILSQLEPLLHATDVQNAKEWIAHGEHGVALELICAQLQEYQLTIPAQVLASVKEAASEMGLPASLWQGVQESGAQAPETQAASAIAIIEIRKMREQGMSFEEAVARHTKDR